jgi:hypothetical protein
VKDVITSKWDGAVMQPFGSYPVGLSIFLSDIDVSILGMGVDDDKNNQRRLSIECNTSLNTTLNKQKQKIQFTGATIDLTETDQAGKECSSEAISSRTSKASHSSSTNKQQQSVISIDDSDEDVEEVISWSLDTYSASNAAVLVTDTDSSGNRIDSIVDVPSVSTAASLDALKSAELAHTAKQGQEQVETQGNNVNNETVASVTMIEIASAALDVTEHSALETPNNIKKGPFSSIGSSVVSNGAGAGGGEGDVLQSLHTGDGSISSATGGSEEKKSELKEEGEVVDISSKKLSGAKRERECDDDDDDKDEGEGENEDKQEKEQNDEGRYLGEDAFDDFDGKDDYSEDEDDDDVSGDSSYRSDDDDDEEEDDYDYDDYDDEDNFIMKDEEQRGEIKGRKSLRISSAKKSSGQ